MTTKNGGSKGKAKSKGTVPSVEVTVKFGSKDTGTKYNLEISETASYFLAHPTSGNKVVMPFSKLYITPSK